jgi:diguanylate cyclase (GGDEF)-like protein
MEDDQQRMFDAGRDRTLVEDERLAAIQSRLNLAFLIVFVVTMAACATTWLWPGGDDRGSRLLVLLGTAILLPSLMALLSRRVMRSIESLDAERVRLFEMYARARVDALLDALTGLGNHRAFQEELVRQLEAAARYRYPVSLLLIDVDDLKKVNDQHGHSGGDELLATVGRIITAIQRRSDRAFRIGGDEFAVLLPQTEIPEATNLARRILASALGGGDPGQPIPPFSLSVGVSSFPSPSKEGHELYRHADTALYWSKRHGRTRAEAYDLVRHGGADETRTTTETTAAVKQILETRALRPVYQPIFSLETGETIGFEGLIRPGDGTPFRDAATLFSAAQAAGRMVELDAACFAIVAGGCGSLGPGQFLSINLSAPTLEAADFLPTALISILLRNGLQPGDVVLELTEREVVADVEQLRRNVAACQKTGLRVAADDVGAGNAGLRLLSEVHFDIVKLDLSLVQGGATPLASQAVLRGLRELAVRSNAVVVAEGVETAPQLAVLRSLGIDAAQGYLLGRPGAERQTKTIDLDALVNAGRLTPARGTTAA